MPETNFFWDPVEDNIIQERDETGAITAEYATEPYLYGNLISQNRGGVESQYHFDSQGSTLALTDDNQQVTDTYAYSAFGEVTEHTGSTANPFQYIGQKQYYRHDEAGEYDVRQRPLCARYGRWLTKDPISLIESLFQQYAYVLNGPLSFFDPSGLQEESCDGPVCCCCVNDITLKGFSKITTLEVEGPNNTTVKKDFCGIEFTATIDTQWLPATKKSDCDLEWHEIQSLGLMKGRKGKEEKPGWHERVGTLPNSNVAKTWKKRAMACPSSEPVPIQDFPGLLLPTGRGDATQEQYILIRVASSPQCISEKKCTSDLKVRCVHAKIEVVGEMCSDAKAEEIDCKNIPPGRERKLPKEPKPPKKNP